MLRFQEKELTSWFKQTPRKPLVLRGARQVGKTTLVTEFAKKAQLNLHAVNLERHGTLRDSIESLDVEAFLRDVQLITRLGSLSDPHSILFIDEIQAIPKAITLLRYLYEDKKEIAVLAAGSLLEFALANENENFSMPVGRVEYLFLGPLTFKEFLTAADQSPLVAIIEKYSLGESFSVTAHKQLLELLRVYLLIGGMPEAVENYLLHRDFSRVAKVHGSILGTYREDFSKYAKKSQLMKLQKIFDYLPFGVGKKVKYVNIDRDSKSSDLKSSIQLLEMANVLSCAYSTDAVRPPLGSKKNLDVYKPYFLDCGLLNSLSDLTLVPMEICNIFSNGGEIAEQFIAQHVAYFGERYSKPLLYYWLREGKSNNAEVDFLFTHLSHVIPVEVKSGMSGTLKSLHQFIGRSDAPHSVRFDLNMPSAQEIKAKLTTQEDPKIDAKLISLPIYMVEETKRIIGEVP